MIKMLAGAIVTLALVAVAATPGFAQTSAQQGQSSTMHDQQTRSERMLEDRVFVRLAQQAWAGGDFKVKADGNTVTLSGTVPSEQSKQRMLRIARRTFGVFEVRDQLRVSATSASAPAGTTVPDRELAQRVAQKIASSIDGAKAGEDWWLTGWRVEGPDNRWTFTVEAENGNIWLEGEVPRNSQIRAAIEAARQVNGVRSVRADLEIDRRYYGYPAYGYGYPYTAWHHPYADPDYYFVLTGDSGAQQGMHAMTGEVTKLDKQKGMLSLKTAEGTLDLHFPPSQLRNVKQGDRITVQLGLKPAGTAPAASPRTDSGASSSKQKSQQK